MLTYVAALSIDWIVRGPWRDPMSFGFPLTPYYPDAGLISAMHLPFIGRLGQLHWGVPAALLIAVAGYIVLSRMLGGFQVKLMGDAPRAGTFAGFQPEPGDGGGFLLASGALAGLAGMVEFPPILASFSPTSHLAMALPRLLWHFLRG